MKLSISPVSLIRDLGILTNNKLTMSQHICTVVKKAQTRASLIYKCFHSTHRSTLLKAYITYVRPLLEYDTLVWSPHTVADVTKIESVQQSFTKRLPGLSNLSYTKCVDLTFSNYFTLRTGSITHGHNDKLFLNYSRLNVRKHFFQ